MRSFRDILEIKTPQSSGTVELWFLDSPLLLFFAFRCTGHIFPNLWPPSVAPGGHLFPRQSLPDHVCPSGGFSFNTTNLVNPTMLDLH